MFLNFSWRDLEPTPGVFALNDFTNAVSYLTTIRGFRMHLVISVVNGTVRETPTDLMGSSFDSQGMKTRFHLLLDQILPSMGPNVRYLSIGNEVDKHLSLHPGDWLAYQSFYEDAVHYIHGRSGSIKLGVTTTFGGASGMDSLKVRNLNDSSDVFILTYYPVGSQFVPRTPQIASSEIDRMLLLAHGRPLVLQEVGYPAAVSLGSSGQAQAEFVTAVFTAWATHRDEMPFVNFYCMHDPTLTQCDSIAAYFGLPTDQAYKDFLSTLGFRSVNGAPKPAWQAFLSGAATGS
jgi:hypothetical protein